jgi:hypothetical protein
MEDVGTPPRLAALPLEALEHGVGEGVDQDRQLLLGHHVQRPGPEVMDPEAGLDLNRRRQAAPPRSGVHVTVHARPDQARRQLAHVHVHAATVARSGLGEGRRMEGEDGEAVHDG